MDRALTDPDVTLSEFAEKWQGWPQSVRKLITIGGRGKTEDPRSAPGVIGAFNRAFDIPSAIARFDIPYDETNDPDRYTYRLGTGTGGARVYDDGLKLHSDHATDPAQGQHSAFHLVRIHRFGAEDVLQKEDSPTSDRSSFKRMIQFAHELPEVQAELRQEALNDFDDLGPLSSGEVGNGRAPSAPAASHDHPQLELCTLDVLGPPAQPQECVVEKLVPAALVTVFVAGGGKGKTAILVRMAIDVAAGQPFSASQLATRQGRVVIVTAEDEYEEYRRRFQAALSAITSLEFADHAELGLLINENVRIVDVTSLARKLTVSDPRGSVIPSGFRNELVRLLGGLANLRLLIFETASQLNGGDEAAPSVAMLLSELRAIAAHTGAAVVLTHHTTKEASRSGAKDDLVGRGSAVWRDNSRSLINLTEANGLIVLTHARASRTGKAEATGWRLEAFGTSVAAVPVGVVHAQREPRGGIQKILYGVAMEYLSSGNRLLKDELLVAAKSRMLMPDKRDNRLRDLRRACVALVNEGFLVEQDGHVSLPTPVPTSKQRVSAAKREDSSNDLAFSASTQPWDL